MKQRIIACSLALLMLAAGVAAPMLAAQAYDITVIGAGHMGDEIIWRLASDYILRIDGEGSIDDLYCADRYPWFMPNYEKVEGIELSDGIVHIGKYAFESYPSLRRVVLPASITSIGEWAFHDCPLTDVWFAGTEEQWSKIEIGRKNDALLNARIHCESKTRIGTFQRYSSGYKWPGGPVWSLTGTTLTISGEGAVRLPDSAFIRYFPRITGNRYEFFDSEVETLILDAGVTWIESGVFSDFASLKEVRYTGSKEQWEAMKRGGGNDPLLMAKIIFNYQNIEPQSGRLGDGTWKYDPESRRLSTSGISGPVWFALYDADGRMLGWDMTNRSGWAQLDGDFVSVRLFIVGKGYVPQCKAALIH